MTQPKPCPFCKSMTLKAMGKLGVIAWVFCPACRCEGPPAKTRVDAIAKWNAAPRKGDDGD